MAKELIRLTNLTMEFDGERVLDSINLYINDHEFLTLLGPSGCGKTTTLRIIGGFLTPTSGDVLFDGQKINDVPAYKRQINTVFQRYALFPHLDVYDNVALPMKFWGINTKTEEAVNKINSLIRLVGLEDKKHSKPAELSGGQKQRVAIARALVLEPKVLLCDEATSALDPAITREILSLLQQINEELGITILVVTHQMEVVKQICQRVSFLKDGRVLAEGKPEDLFIHPIKEVKAFLQEESTLLPATGVNIQMFFTDKSSDPVVTMMARELDMNFSIVWGKLEDFRSNVFGSLVINVDESVRDKVTAYLDKEGVSWEVLN